MKEVKKKFAALSISDDLEDLAKTLNLSEEVEDGLDLDEKKVLGNPSEERAAEDCGATPLDKAPCRSEDRAKVHDEGMVEDKSEIESAKEEAQKIIVMAKRKARKILHKAQKLAESQVRYYVDAPEEEKEEAKNYFIDNSEREEPKGDREYFIDRASSIARKEKAARRMDMRSSTSSLTAEQAEELNSIFGLTASSRHVADRLTDEQVDRLNEIFGSEARCERREAERCKDERREAERRKEARLELGRRLYRESLRK